jgi:antagonist of KipI
MDVPAWRLANALVGNRDDEAAIECTLSGPTLRFEQAAWVALTGAAIRIRVADQDLPCWTACFLPAGSVLELGGMDTGCRSYLAVRGGFDLPPVLGSRSTDLHAHLGAHAGRALRAGDLLPLGSAAIPTVTDAFAQPTALRWCIDPQPWFDFGQAPLALMHGSHWAALDEASQRRLFELRFSLSKDSNRTACRLDGHALQLRQPLELISEPALPGTLQLPPSGQPIVLMAEAPVTGGYPRIGQVAAVDLPHLAQRRPGDTVSFRHSTLAEATGRLHEREHRMARLLRHIAQRLQQPG